MNAVIWSKENCPYCEQAKEFLTKKEIKFEERKIGHGWTREDLLESIPTARTVPQIFIDDVLIGGFNNLLNYFKEKNAI